MAEVASNIESRVNYEDIKRMLEDKISKSEIGFHMQDKVSFDDLNHYLKSNQLRNGTSQRPDFENELNRLR